MRKSTPCLVCQSEAASYKFRCCQRSFCCKDCFSKHTECDAPVANRPFIPERRYIRLNNGDLGLAEDELISEEDLDKISKSVDVTALLADPLLQRILTRLDMSRNRRETFSKLSETTPIFIQLLETIGSVIGIHVDDTATA